jgi:predicted ester cyclase
MVVTRWTARGTNREESLGSLATGDQVKFTGIEFDRVVGGKLDESWVGYHLDTDSPQDPERVKRVFAKIQHAFPDLHVAQADSVTEGDKVAFRWMMSGTHKGELMGVAPTGERVTVMGIDMIYVEDGQILAYWGEFDVMGMLRQLGITPPSEQVES